jgi:hypothetical protein
MDFYQRYHTGILQGDPVSNVELVIRLADEAPDDDHLCALGVVLLDPLLDLHWSAISSRFEAAMMSNRNLRKAFTCSWNDIPKQDADTLWGLVEQDEDIGHQDAT